MTRWLLIESEFRADPPRLYLCPRFFVRLGTRALRCGAARRCASSCSVCSARCRNLTRASDPPVWSPVGTIVGEMCGWSAWRLTGAASLSGGLIDAFVATSRSGASQKVLPPPPRVFHFGKELFIIICIYILIIVRACACAPMGGERRKHLAQCVFVVVLS